MRKRYKNKNRIGGKRTANLVCGLWKKKIFMGKRICFCLLLAVCFRWAVAQEKTTEMDRVEICKQNYAALFGGEALSGQGADPEFMDILQKFIFGDVFSVGKLDMETRELITCTILATMQTLPQLRAHAGAALRVGVHPVELREAIYQCAPFIGFPKTLNAVSVLNEVFAENGIEVPLPPQATATEENRYEKGHAIQHPVYGDEIARKMAPLPAGMGVDVARFLTAYAFGDILSRNGLDQPTRELLIYCVLTATGAEVQLEAHAKGNLKAGNTRETLAAAVVQCLPYVGFPLAFKSLEVIMKTGTE